MGIDRVLVPTDIDGASDELVDRALEFAAENDAEVTLLGVVEDPAISGSIYGEPPPEADDGVNSATERMEELVSRAEEYGVDADPVVKTGDVTDTLVEVSERGGFDVVVLDPLSGARTHEVAPGDSARELASLTDVAVLSVPVRRAR